MIGCHIDQHMGEGMLGPLVGDQWVHPVDHTVHTSPRSVLEATEALEATLQIWPNAYQPRSPLLTTPQTPYSARYEN